MTGFIRKTFSPKMPKASTASPVAAPLTPTVDDARQTEEELTRLRKRRGLASTFLTRLFGRPAVRTTNSASALLGGGGDAGAAGGGDRATIPGGTAGGGTRANARYMNR